MYKFCKSSRTFSNRNATMLINDITAVGTTLGDRDNRGQCFLYDDIMSYSFSPMRFIEIVRVVVNKNTRRNGHGSKLIDLLKEEYPDVPIFAKAGVLTEELYNELKSEDRLQDYIYENIVPFYESNGFIDVNDTILCHSECVIMCYPESLAEKYIDRAEAWAREHKNL